MLDFARASAQKQFQVQPAIPNFYACWRTQNNCTAAVHEALAPPPEKLLQAIWQHQRLRRDQLCTLDGQPIRVLHPGFGSVEGGPDFRDAVIRFGDRAPISGDVEVDVHDTGWRAHRHDRNAAFQRVILHVVWEGKPSATRPPTLLLHDVLDAPIQELRLQLEHHSLRTLPETSLGKCCAPLRELAPGALLTLLREAAHVRLYNKAALFRARAQHVGWEQVLWEGLFRALGYKHNIWPMQQLAEARARWAAGPASLLTIQARLLGLSGLLPTELNRKQPGADEYLRGVWDSWWREQDMFSDYALPRGLWRLHGLRPANHPHRRLALAAHWAQDEALVAKIEAWCHAPLAAGKLRAALAKIFAVKHDDFWFWHLTFRSARLKKPLPLLGEARVTDLAINVVLPWLLARAVAGGNEKLRKEIEARYDSWPAAEDNSVLKLARQRLLGKSRAAASSLQSACVQQGLLQVGRDFCDLANATCAGCQFPELVRIWQLKTGATLKSNP